MPELNDYEWRAYRALLGVDSATAYELGKRSGIPLSRCYEVARSLAVESGALDGERPRDLVAPRERDARALAQLVGGGRVDAEQCPIRPPLVVVQLRHQ